MGVPSYFHWLITRFQEDILKPCNKTKISIDNLYLDLNCAIHPAVKHEGLSYKDMPKAVWEYIQTILKVCTPDKLLYVAIDGVAPQAKMRQQRMRRFNSIQERQQLQEIHNKYGIAKTEPVEDFNMISPGTQFMADLSVFLQGQFARLRQEVPINIIFSDASVPGEGEHKIMDHIRSHQPKSSAIYGLDSDLIFLCLGNYQQNMYLLRERQHFGPKFKCLKDNRIQFVYLSVERLRSCLIKILNPYVSLRELENYNIFGNTSLDCYSTLVDQSFQEHCEIMLRDKFFTKPVEETNLIFDYIFMSFLLGNDFLPPLPSLRIKEGGLDQLLRVYKIVQMHKKTYLIQIRDTAAASLDGCQINMDFFKDLLYQLYLLEDNMLISQCNQKYNRIRDFYHSRKYLSATPCEREILKWESVEHNWKDDIYLGQADWRARYYATYFGIGSNKAEETIMKICKNYLEGMIWSFKYYGSGCPSWNWSYKYNHAPSVWDLYHSVANVINIEEILFTPSNPVTPLEQLLSILPPASCKLLPTPLQRLLTSDRSPIIYLYPTEFEIHVLNERARWECHPILPLISETDIRNALSTCIEQLSETDLVRNKVGSVYLF